MARDCPRGKPAAQPFSGGVMGLGEAGGRPGARFSKLPVITEPVKLFCFPF